MKKKNTLEGINNRLDDTEDRISDLQGRAVEINQAEQQKEFFKNEQFNRPLVQHQTY